MKTIDYLIKIMSDDRFYIFYYFWLALCMSYTIFGCGSDKEQTIYVLFGQSNAVGIDIGPEKGLEDILGNINLVKTADGGTLLSCSGKDAQGISRDCWLGNLLENTITEIEKKRDSLGNAFVTYEYIFIQGEADALNMQMSYQYHQNLDHMISIIESRVGPGHWTFSLLRTERGRMGRYIVRRAISTIAAQKGACLEDLDNYDSPDKTHLYPKEYERLGQNIAKCLLTH